MFFAPPCISFSTLTSDGIEHVTAVYADDKALFVITEDAFVTDAPSAETYLFETSPDAGKSEFRESDFAGLPPRALQLMAGHRALQATLKFRDEYAPLADAFDPDEPVDDNSGFDDDDLDADEGVFL